MQTVQRNRIISWCLVQAWVNTKISVQSNKGELAEIELPETVLRSKTLRN